MKLTWVSAAFMVVAIILGGSFSSRSVERTTTNTPTLCDSPPPLDSTQTGLGVLGLPWAFSKMGWVLGVLFLAISTLGSIYSGVLLGELVAMTGVKEYTMLGSVAFGERGYRIVAGVQYAYLSGIVVSTLKTSARGLQQVVTALDGDLCLVAANAIIAVAMIAPLQVQQLGNATIIAVVGVVAIVVALFIFFAEISKQHDERPTAGFPSTSSFTDFADAFATFIFAYQG